MVSGKGGGGADKTDSGISREDLSVPDKTEIKVSDLFTPMGLHHADLIKQTPGDRWKHFA